MDISDLQPSLQRDRSRPCGARGLCGMVWFPGLPIRVSALQLHVSTLSSYDLKGTYVCTYLGVTFYTNTIQITHALKKHSVRGCFAFEIYTVQCGSYDTRSVKRMYTEENSLREAYQYSGIDRTIDRSQTKRICNQTLELNQIGKCKRKNDGTIRAKKYHSC